MKYVMEYCRDHLSMLSTKAQRKLNQNHITLMTNIICNFTSSDFYFFFLLKVQKGIDNVLFVLYKYRFIIPSVFDKEISSLWGITLWNK